MEFTIVHKSSILSNKFQLKYYLLLESIKALPFNNNCRLLCSASRNLINSEVEKIISKMQGMILNSNAVMNKLTLNHRQPFA